MSFEQQVKQQIQREMEEEARIEKKYKAIVKKTFKKTKIRNFHIVSSSKEADAVIILDRTNLINYKFILYNKTDGFQKLFIESPNYFKIFLKNNNPHDGKKATLGDEKSSARKLIL